MPGIDVAADGVVALLVCGVSTGLVEGHGFDSAYLSPRITFTCELGGGTAVLAGNAFDIQKRLPLSRSLALEVGSGLFIVSKTACSIFLVFAWNLDVLAFVQGFGGAGCRPRVWRYLVLSGGLEVLSFVWGFGGTSFCPNVSAPTCPMSCR
jgi:hypothetical protein